MLEHEVEEDYGEPKVGESSQEFLVKRVTRDAFVSSTGNLIFRSYTIGPLIEKCLETVVYFKVRNMSISQD